MYTRYFISSKRKSANCATALQHHSKTVKHATNPLPAPNRMLFCSRSSNWMHSSPSITVEGKLITTSLFTIPCFEILQGSIPFLMLSTVLGAGGSTRKITWVAPTRQLAVVTSRRTSQSSDYLTIKAGSTLPADRYEQCPRALATSALTVTLLQVLYPRQTEAH